jgi:hypothetical protein
MGQFASIPAAVVLLANRLKHWVVESEKENGRSVH